MITDPGLNLRYVKLGSAAMMDAPVSGNATSGEVVRGNDTRLATMYSGVTDANGNYAVTYATPYSTKPKVIPSVEGGTNKDTSVLTSTVTGFNVLVQRRNDIVGLLPTYAPVVGATVNVTVTQ